MRPQPSLPSLIKSCKTLLHLHQLHAHVIRKGLEQDHFIVSHLLSLSSTSSLPYAVSIFHRLHSPSTILFNILLRSLSPHSHHDTFSFFIGMKRSLYAPPDSFTYPSLIKSCSGWLRDGQCIHGSVVRCGVGGDVYVGSCFVDFYGKCKEVASARKVFDEMTERNVVTWTTMVVGYLGVGDMENAKKVFDAMPERNLNSWNAMIGGLAKGGDLRVAKMLFDLMPERDVVSFTVLIDGYAKAGDMAAARALFEAAPDRDIVAWSALISGYAQNGQPGEAVKLFRKMELMNVKPDEFILVSLMSACSQLGSLDLAKWVDCYSRESSVDIGRGHVIAALIDMNAKCGNMVRAKTLFEEMPRRDLITYCSMIQGFSIHGQANQAVTLFERMLSEGLIPDEVAFNVILTACCKGGFVEEGWHYFETMKTKYSIVPSPDHYACMVDLLSRTGRLKAAYELLKSMPVEPNAGAWGALLGACKLYGDVDLGEIVANILFELEPQNAGTYVLLSDIYAAADQWSDVSLVRERMKERGLRKIPGRSWV